MTDKEFEVTLKIASLHAGRQRRSTMTGDCLSIDAELSDLYKTNASITDIVEFKSQLNILIKYINGFESEIFSLEKKLGDYKKRNDKLHIDISQFESQKEKTKEQMKDINNKLEKEKNKTSSGRSVIIKYLLAIFLSVFLAVVLIYSAVNYAGKPIVTSFEVVYDIGNMIEALLLGSGALIAGVAYAVSTLKNKADD